MMANGIIGRFYKSHPEPATKKVPESEGDSVAVVTESKSPNGPLPMAGMVSNGAAAGESGPDMVAERVNLHRYLLDRINLGMLDTMENAEIAVRPVILSRQAQRRTAKNLVFVTPEKRDRSLR